MAEDDEKVLAAIKREVYGISLFLLLYKMLSLYIEFFFQQKRELEMLRIQMMSDLKQDKELAHNKCQSV